MGCKSPAEAQNLLRPALAFVWCSERCDGGALATSSPSDQLLCLSSADCGGPFGLACLGDVAEDWKGCGGGLSRTCKTLDLASIVEIPQWPACLSQRASR